MRIVLGVDLGTNSCSLVGLDEAGGVVLRRRMRRETVITFAGKLPDCVVATRRAAGRITWAASWRAKGTRYGSCHRNMSGPI